MPESKDSKKWSGGLKDSEERPNNSFYNSHVSFQNSQGRRPGVPNASTPQSEHPSRVQVPPQPSSNIASQQWSGGLKDDQERPNNSFYNSHLPSRNSKGERPNPSAPQSEHPSRFQVPPQAISKTPSQQLEGIPGSVSPFPQVSHASTLKGGGSAENTQVPSKPGSKTASEQFEAIPSSAASSAQQSGSKTSHTASQQASAASGSKVQASSKATSSKTEKSEAAESSGSHAPRLNPKIQSSASGSQSSTAKPTPSSTSNGPNSQASAAKPAASAKVSPSKSEASSSKASTAKPTASSKASSSKSEASPSKVTSSASSEATAKPSIKITPPSKPTSASPASQLANIPPSHPPCGINPKEVSTRQDPNAKQPTAKVSLLKSALKATSTTTQPGKYHAAFGSSKPEPARSPSPPQRREVSILPNHRENIDSSDSDSHTPKAKAQKGSWKQVRVNSEETEALLLRVISRCSNLNPGFLYDTIVHASSLGAISAQEYLDLLDFFYRFLPQILIAPKSDPVVVTVSQLRRFERIMETWGPEGLKLSEVRERARRLRERGEDVGGQRWYSRPRARGDGGEYRLRREREGEKEKARERSRSRERRKGWTRGQEQARKI